MGARIGQTNLSMSGFSWLLERLFFFELVLRVTYGWLLKRRAFFSSSEGRSNRTPSIMKRPSAKQTSSIMQRPSVQQRSAWYMDRATSECIREAVDGSD